MPAGYSFRPRAWALALAAVACAAGIALGIWQTERAREKRKAEARAERISVRGEFLPERTVLLDNKLRRGRPGYEVVTPLRLAAGQQMHVLVNRGWIAAGPGRSRLPDVRTPQEPVVVRGRAVVPGRFLELSDEVTRGPVWQNLTLERYRSAMPIAIQPFVIQQDAAAAPDDGLVREWLPPDLGVEKHYGYSFQWFALSVLILVFYLATHVRRDRST